MRKRLISILVMLALVTSLFAGCQFISGNKNKIKIVASIFPIYDWAANITAGNKDIELTLLVSNGTDLHSYQPSTADIVTIADCDLFIYVGGESDGWATDVLNNNKNDKRKAISLMEVLGDKARTEETIEGMEAEEEEEEYDEHVWLSLKNAAIFVDAIKDAMSSIDSSKASDYSTNAKKYKEKLNALDKDYQTAIDGADLKTLLFADRFPFRYLLDDYGIKYYAAFSGCSAETEASFSTVAFLVNKVDELSLPAVLKTEGSSDKLAQTIVSSTVSKDAQILTLDSMQSTTLIDIKKGTSYLSVMEKNLDVLKKALRSKAVPATPTQGGTVVTQEPTNTTAPTNTQTPTNVPKSTNTPAPTNTSAPTNTPEPTNTSAPTNTPEPTNTATPEPTNTTAPTNTPSPTLTNTPVPTVKPTATNTPRPTNTAKPTATNSPKPTNTAKPTNTPKPTATPTPSGVPIVWKDIALEKAVRKAIGKSTGTVMESDVKSLTTLDLTSCGISKIDNLSVFTGLKSLYLNDNKISDISAVASLTSLTELSISFNQITTLEPVAKLTNLTILRATDNKLTSVAPILNLTKIELITLGNVMGGDNAIPSVFGLKNLKSTASVSLVGNKATITDWNLISHIKSVAGRPTN